MRLRRELQRLIDFGKDYFSLFGLAPRYRFDPERLESAYRALQREIHPDRHAAGDEAQRRLALQSSARVNEAYRALKDPVARAQYLLSLRGIDALAETDTVLPADFLERELERREAVADAQAGGDAPRLNALLREVRMDGAGVEARLAEELDGESLNAARDSVRELKFLAKVADDIETALADLES